jgi:dTDP-4-amino-4,6-dideoxygalactose transaminase
VHYPVPLHEQPGLAGQVGVGAGGLARSETHCREVFSLPLYPELTDEEVGRVEHALRALAGDRRLLG